ncbi:U3 snoRNP protein [Coemansia sp. RSA 2618]|nr:U3 snoRNP protein [Coemansia sp. RSA 2618]
MGKKRGTAKKAERTAAAADTFAQTVPDSFMETFVDSPSTFIVPTDEARAAAMDVVSRTYDAANIAEKFGLFDDWSAVMASGFDPNVQLWELINIRNEPVLKNTTDVMKELSLLLDSVADDESDSDESQDAMDVSDDQQVASDAETSESEDEDEDEDATDEGSDLESDAELSAEELAEGAEESDDEDDSEEESSAKPSVIDDEFFSLAEMEAFADKAEQEEMRDRAILAGNYPKRSDGDGESSEEGDDDDDESIDLFQDHGALDDEDDDEDDDDSVMGGKRVDELMYEDFYKPPSNSKRGKAKAVREKHAKRVKFDPSVVDSDGASGPEDEPESESESESGTATRKSNLFDDDEDDEKNGMANDGKSDFERRQEKLQTLIGKLEDEAVAGKHWTMTGEVGSNVRPQNSLLAEDLDFDHMQKPVPVATQEATLTLEDLIKRRILNEEWDDVERKKDIQAKPFKPSEFIELNDKQSKKSLAEEYESEYMAQKAGDAFVPENDAKLVESHRDVDSQMRNLFTQLDALSHFHFAPKPAAMDIEIRTNTPALQMEEKLPVSMTQADQLAPSEIFDKRQKTAGRTGDIVGDTELSREERKLRRQRKKNEKKKKQAAAKASTSKPKPSVKAAS